MSGLNDMRKRIAYRGGASQVDRMIKDKEKSFKSSLYASYQSATAVLSDAREFRCLINPNKLSMELDDKVLSIPFEDKQINGTETEKIGVKCGDVIQWKENGTYWIVYSQYLQEIAYFRGQMRQCESDALLINGTPYRYYLKGPDEKSIDWQKTKHFIFNDLNYTVEIYISNNSETNEFFQRFKKCKVKGKSFEVQAVDRLSLDGLLIVYLKEDYENEWADEEPEEVIPPVEETPEEEPMPALYRVRDTVAPSIQGPVEVYPYQKIEYTILNAAGGEWLLSNRRARIIKSSESSVEIEITTGRSGSVSLIYRQVNGEDIIFNINILSL